MGCFKMNNLHVCVLFIFLIVYTILLVKYEFQGIRFIMIRNYKTYKNIMVIFVEKCYNVSWEYSLNKIIIN